MTNIYVIQGPDKGQSLDITANGCIIGRGTDTTHWRDKTISREHTRIIVQNDRYYVRDLESANGTYVNGVRIGSELQLRHGDHIRTGNTVMVFSEDKPIELPPDETEFGDLIDIDDQGSLIDSSIMAAIPADRESLLAPSEPSQANKHLRVLYELLNTIGSIYNIDQMLHKVMELIFREINVDRGFILMRNESTKKFDPVVVRYRKMSDSGKIATSNTIIKHILNNKEAVLCTNAMGDKRFNKGDSIQGYGMRSVICSPIIARDNILGIIHIDCAVSTSTYTPEQLRLLSAIGYQTGLAIQNIKMYIDSVRVERLAATGQTVAALSHYIKNILQGLQGGSDTVELGFRSTNLKIAETGWRIVNRNLDKIQHLMLNMLAFSKDREPRLEQMQLNVIISDVMDLTKKRADDRGVMLITDLNQHMPAFPVDQDGIHQVILNIVNNAIEAVPKNSGAITIKTFFNENDQEAIISIGDNGPGITDNQIDKVFEIFHSTKGHGGTGLGLAVAKKIVDEHHGKLEVVSHAGEGTIFTIHLPTTQKGKSAERTGGVEDTL